METFEDYAPVLLPGVNPKSRCLRTVYRSNKINYSYDVGNVGFRGTFMVSGPHYTRSGVG